MTTASGSPEKESFILVTFRYGDPSDPDFAKYAAWNRAFEDFAATPEMDVEIPDNTGTFDEKEVRILLGVDDFTGPVSSGLPHSPMFLKIEEVTAGMFPGDAGSRKILYRGRITRTIRNFQGRNDTVAFFSLPIKSRIDVPMGLQCNHHCAWRLFGRGCGLVETSHDQTGQIASMDGKEITISANAGITAPIAPGGDNTRFWERGYLEKDGLTIGIHIWSISDPTVFVLRRRPPDSWLLAGVNSIRFLPGCHKTVEDCRNVWNNEQHFGGFGYAMLPYNPLYQNPQ
jgi:hypothetical protein